MLRRVISLALAAVLVNSMSAQLSRTHIGGGATPYALSTDYRAIGFNPALMTVSGWGGEAIGASGSFEGGFMLSSKAFARADLWNQILEPTSANSKAWTQQEWVSALAEEQLDMGASFMTMGMARRWGKWSVGEQRLSSSSQVGRRDGVPHGDGLKDECPWARNLHDEFGIPVAGIPEHGFLDLLRPGEPD